MTDTATESPSSKSGKGFLLIATTLLLIGVGSGFFAVRGGLVSWLSQKEGPGSSVENSNTSAAEVEYLHLDPLVITLHDQDGALQLRFRAQLEIYHARRTQVQNAIPRIIDMMNGYLRAVPPADLRKTSALVQLRSQMLRRVSVLVGEGAVSDLLIMEFVLN